MRARDVLLGALAGALATLGLVALALPPVPRLIGHECAMTGGDIWAMEESDFPPCYAIERNK
jgi:hypothetical protein